MDLKKNKALILIDLGKSKTFVCKKLKLKPKILNKWIIKDTRLIKDRILSLYFLGYSKKIIRTLFYIKSDEFDNIVNQANDDIFQHALEKDFVPIKSGFRLARSYRLNQKPNGFLSWNDNILNQNRIKKL